jgi:lipopolysaccharide/colanic/teichoic acid biosynthesis glycosyltransferase
MAPWRLHLKRAFDLAVALVLLLVLGPFLLAVGLAIRFDSSGGAFFRQDRLGLHGRPFRVWKFRTMVAGAQNVGTGLLTSATDARITRLGHWLRKYRIDEFPQLFNVVRGEMSLVGPRPLVATYFEHWGPYAQRRLEVLPGMTGWQQINGGETHDWEQRSGMDVWYVDHWSFRLDLKILFRTPLVVFQADTVHGEAGLKRSAIPPGVALDEPSPDTAQAPKSDNEAVADDAAVMDDAEPGEGDPGCDVSAPESESKSS